MEQYLKAVHAPFDDLATIYLSGDAKLWWRTRYEDVLESRWEINAWEELNRNREFKETGAFPAWERCMARTRVPDADLRSNQSRSWGTYSSYRQIRTLL